MRDSQKWFQIIRPKQCHDVWSSEITKMCVCVWIWFFNCSHGQFQHLGSCHFATFAKEHLNNCMLWFLELHLLKVLYDVSYRHADYLDKSRILTFKNGFGNRSLDNIKNCEPPSQWYVVAQDPTEAFGSSNSERYGEISEDEAEKKREPYQILQFPSILEASFQNAILTWILENMPRADVLIHHFHLLLRACRACRESV